MHVCNLCYRKRFLKQITVKLEKDLSDDDYVDGDDDDVIDDKNNRMMMIMMMIRIKIL